MKTSRKRKLKPRQMKTLLRVKKTGTGGKQYRVKPSEVRDDEIKKMVKMVNDSLYRLEKAGVEGQSAIYRTIEKYALTDPNGTGKIYNVNTDTGSIRVTKDIKRYGTGEERSRMVNVLRGILSAQTRTVTGTRQAVQKAFETVQERYNFEGTQEQYGNLWKIFKEQVEPDRRAKIGSDTVIKLMENINLYEMDDIDLAESMNYLNRGRDAGLSAIANRFPDYIKSV